MYNQMKLFVRGFALKISELDDGDVVAGISEIETFLTISFVLLWYSFILVKCKVW